MHKQEIMENTSPLKRLWQLIFLDKKEISSIYFYAILSGLVQLTVPLGVQAIIGFVLGASMVTSIYVLIIVVVLGVFTVGIMQINQMKIIEKIQQNIFTRYAFQFADTIPRFDLKKMDNYYLPVKVNQFFDTLSVQKSLSKLLLDIPTASIQLLFGLILLSLYHPVFIAFGFLLLFILWVILKFTGKNGLKTSMEESTYKYNVVAWLQEMSRIIKSFKFSQGTHINLTKTDKNVVGYLTSRTAHFKVLVFQYKSLVIFKVIITTAMLTVGTYLLLSQQLNIGEFIAAEIVILTVINAVEKLIGSLDSVYDTITGLEKLASVIESPLEKDGAMPYVSNQKGISVEMLDFNFKYHHGQQVLKNVNLKIPANSIVCISGNEGSGKSTFLKVLTGNYSDFDGAILLNNIPIGNYQLESLRSKIGIYLNQQDLFVGSVWENISFGRKEILPEQISTLAEKLGVKSYINTLHKGYDTQIDPMGKKLPSNIIKKLLLLRAFSNSPDLLLLEEPWQGLEESTKKEMTEYILNDLKNVTVFVVTNDLDFAKRCQYQITIENSTSNITKNS